MSFSAKRWVSSCGCSRPDFTTFRSIGVVTVSTSHVVMEMLRSQSCSRCSSTAGRQVDDTSIHAAVSAKLTVDRFSNIVNIDINVTNGVVTLAGEVPNAKVSAEAQSEARSVFGVVKVINNLQVKSPPSA